MSDREQRQYDLIQQRIDAFRKGGLSVGSLIADLEGLVSALEETPQEWTDAFVESCGSLEMVCGVALDRGQPMPDARDDKVAAALDALDALLRERSAERQ